MTNRCDDMGKRPSRKLSCLIHSLQNLHSGSQPPNESITNTCLLFPQHSLTQTCLSTQDARLVTTRQWGDKPPTGRLVDLSLNLEAECYLDVTWWDFHIESDPNPSWHLKILLLPMSCIAHRLHREQTLSGRIVGILHANIIPAGIFISLLRHCTMIYTYKYLVVIDIPEYLVYIRSNLKQ